MGKISFTNVTGILALILGCLWVFAWGKEIFTVLFKDTDLFACFFFSLLSVPGIIVAYNGLKLIRQKNKKYIKGTVGTLCIFIAFLAVAVIGSLFENLIELNIMILLLIAMILILPIYIFLSKFLMKQEGLTPIKGEFISRGIIKSIAVLIWLSGSSMIDIHSNLGLKDRLSINLLIDLVSGLAPLIIAVAFYDIAMKIIEKNNAKQAVDHADTATPAPG